MTLTWLVVWLCWSTPPVYKGWLLALVFCAVVDILAWGAKHDL